MPLDAAPEARGQVIIRVSRQSDASRLRGVLELTMAAPHSALSRRNAITFRSSSTLVYTLGYVTQVRSNRGREGPRGAAILLSHVLPWPWRAPCRGRSGRRPGTAIWQHRPRRHPWGATDACVPQGTWRPGVAGVRPRGHAAPSSVGVCGAFLGAWAREADRREDVRRLGIWRVIASTAGG